MSPTTDHQNPPTYRRLRVYTLDPSLATKLDTALINQTVLKVPWETELTEGPTGDYLEVIDFDPASDSFYAPVDLNDPFLLAEDGLAPSEGNPKFHQQMVYAVAMTTITNFERALGRKALWAPRIDHDPETGEFKSFELVSKLRIYPHALREANAFYSPQKKALLFGYFPALLANPGENLPGGLVFTCLSHDVVAHETTHALLDGLHRYFAEPSNPDVLAFHEAFADIVAMFQHFTQPEALRDQISKTRGDLATQNLLGELAHQFGQAIGSHGALRDAIGSYNKDTKKWEPQEPDPELYQATTEPHDRGAILVATLFDAFLAIYKSRTADLLRIASGGTGRLAEGNLHPDLVNRLAAEANKTASHILRMAIRALDYCPPVDITFGEYLRALVTGDWDLVPDDERNYRVAVIEAFRRRGIYPRDVRTLAADALRWQGPP
ncbi:MAG TPA: peptidase S8, partial [Thermoanaerobaculia bacterium]|nr:peptidase S8 [Thermoanaerobaculia bacterium]